MNNRSDATTTDDELKRLQSLFEQSVHGFSKILHQPLQATLLDEVRKFRSQVADDIALVLVQGADCLLNDLLPDAVAGLEPSAKAATGVQEDFKAALSEALSETDREAVEQEALSFAREIAETVLSRWFEILSLPDASTVQGERLNAHLLPGTGTVLSALEEVDFRFYGIDNATVAKALRVYWESVLVDSAPVEFGRGIWIVPDVHDWTAPYRLFNVSAHAREFARRQQETPPVADTKLGERYANVFDIAQQAIASTATPPKEVSPPASLIECCLAWQLAAENETEQAQADADISVRPLIARKSPELKFARSVELLFDEIVSVLWLSPEEASSHVRRRRDMIMPLLQSYSQERGVKLHAVKQALFAAVSLAAATDHRPGTNAPPRTVTVEQLHSDMIQISRQFLDTKPIGARHLLNATLRAPGNVVSMPTVSQLKSMASRQQ